MEITSPCAVLHSQEAAMVGDATKEKAPPAEGYSAAAQPNYQWNQSHTYNKV